METLKLFWTRVNKVLRKNKLPRFNKKEFLKQSAELYQRFHQYMCAGRFGEMSEFVAPAVLQVTNYSTLYSLYAFIFWNISYSILFSRLFVTVCML
jgi:hypothetical protein